MRLLLTLAVLFAFFSCIAGQTPQQIAALATGLIGLSAIGNFLGGIGGGGGGGGGFTTEQGFLITDDDFGGSSSFPQASFGTPFFIPDPPARHGYGY